MKKLVFSSALPPVARGWICGGLTVVAAAVLVACGGGGSPAPQEDGKKFPVSVTCASGGTLTGAPGESAVEVNGRCPALVAQVTTPVSGAIGVAPEESIVVSYSGTVNPASVIAKATMADGTDVAVTTTVATDAKSVAVAPATTKWPSGKTTTVTIIGNDSVGNALPTTVVTFTVAEVLRYKELGVATWTDGYPYMVTSSSRTKVVNTTAWNLGGCLRSLYALADGKIPALCKNFGGPGPWLYYKLYINPVEGKMYEFTGTLPADLGYTTQMVGNGEFLVTFSPQWVNAQTDDANHADWGASAPYADGWLFVYQKSRWLLQYQDAAGNVTVAVPGTTFLNDGTIGSITTYSN